MIFGSSCSSILVNSSREESDRYAADSQPAQLPFRCSKLKVRDWVAVQGSVSFQTPISSDVLKPNNLQLKTKLNQKKSTCPRKLEMEITTMRLALKSPDAGYPSGFLPEHRPHKNQTFKPKKKNSTMAPSVKKLIITDQTGLGFQSEVQLPKY